MGSKSGLTPRRLSIGRHTRRCSVVGLIAVLFLSHATNCLAFTRGSCRSIHRRHSGNSQLHSEPSENTCESQTTSDANVHRCNICSDTFSSRNALFKHLRSHDDGDKSFATKHAPIVRHMIAFKICYIPSNSCIEGGSPTDTNTEAQVAGLRLQKAAMQTLLDLYSNGEMFEYLSCTQSSVASQRHTTLSQEKGVGSAGDVIVVSYKAPELEREDKRDEQLRHILVETRKKLEEQNDKIDGVETTLLACKMLPSNRFFHAERQCTQRSYHYLCPLSWLPDGETLEAWWLRENNVVEDDDGQGRSEPATQHRRNKFKSKPPSDSLRMLAKYLRRAESITLPNRRVRRQSLQGGAADNAPADIRFQLRGSSPGSIRRAAGRYGAFANKERRAWSNFASPELRGDASPNQEQVWKVLDRARISDFVRCRCQGKDRVVAVIEMKGDDFVKEQVRRVVGTALAMTHGWLPADMFDKATQAHTFIETPLAPPGRLYAEGARFHFFEKSSGKGLFEDSDVVGGELAYSTESAITRVRSRLLNKKATEASIDEEAAWLNDLQHVVTPRIRTKLQEETKDRLDNEPATNSRSENYSAAPEFYNRTLAILRGIVASGSWPDTSVARSNVIRRSDGSESDTEGRSGSFTVFNPKMNGICRTQEQLPLGNRIFPELADAVFQLEQELSRTAQLDRAAIDGTLLPNALHAEHRPPSYCCAINCNAKFTPHVDSGRGAGQSTSMIVGLGDYGGGETVVEGVSHDIRYKPLEFDGWQSRHWTNWYRDERFSLVWFSPELKG